MKSTEFTESKYLNAKTAGQLNGKTLVIYEVKAEMVGRDEDQQLKLVIGFEGVEKTCIINRTNNEILTEAYGDETDNWKGKKVILKLVNVNFKGKRTLGIQLEPAPDQTEITGPATEPLPGQAQPAINKKKR